MNQNAFLREIAANPDDDAPRLVYADWLEETGDLIRPGGEVAAALRSRFGRYS